MEVRGHVLLQLRVAARGASSDELVVVSAVLALMVGALSLFVVDQRQRPAVGIAGLFRSTDGGLTPNRALRKFSP